MKLCFRKKKGHNNTCNFISGIKNLKKNAQQPKTCCYELLKNHGFSLKSVGVLNLQESLCPGYIEKLEN